MPKMDSCGDNQSILCLVAMHEVSVTKQKKQQRKARSALCTIFSSKKKLTLRIIFFSAVGTFDDMITVVVAFFGHIKR